MWISKYGWTSFVFQPGLVKSISLTTVHNTSKVVKIAEIPMGNSTQASCSTTSDPALVHKTFADFYDNLSESDSGNQDEWIKAMNMYFCMCECIYVSVLKPDHLSSCESFILIFYSYHYYCYLFIFFALQQTTKCCKSNETFPMQN